jgi:hypothetical protein
MGASTSTGKGFGNSNGLTTKELAILANAPSILIAGIAESDGTPLSPTGMTGEAVFPRTLAGGAENYVVILTTQNGGYAYVVEMNEDNHGDFSGFTFFAEVECTVMYIVSKIGVRPTF